MRFKISYFYAVRFFKRNEIPLSTAMFDPKWYSRGKQDGRGWLDKRGVVNGLRFPPFVPSDNLSNLCRGKDSQDSRCTKEQQVSEVYNKCEFLARYYEQLHQWEFRTWIDFFAREEKKLQAKLNLQEEITFIFLVHEASYNTCSERWPLKKYFAENGYDLEEYTWR